MRVVAGLLAVVIACLALLAFSQAGQLKAAQHDVDGLKAQLADTSAKELAANRISCASRAEQAFRAAGYEDKGDGQSLSSYTDHYNEKWKRCLIAITTNSYSDHRGIVSKSLNDADENRTFGELFTTSNDPKKSDQMVIRCQFSPPGAHAVSCKSTAEYDALTGAVME
jgi:hypothetical protein